ncbi:MAG: peptide chain release factor 2 [Candidatus Staskawiczbacteria bacterium]|nr:peptide chain release factor 2 [Candidatus Staskawiczbacteria bacterium]
MSEKINKIEELENRIHHLMDCLDIAEKEKKLKELEKETLKADFWKDNENATKVQQEISEIKNEIEAVERVKKSLDEKEIERLEFKTFLSGKYDKNNAILEIFSGAGGQDSQDWATMLLRMYERFCSSKGFKTAILHQAFGESGGPEGRIGTKSVTMEIKGNYAYGFLKKESGVHRLVRQSPFNAQKLRHTSFAQVTILPEIDDKDFELEIKPDDLRVDTFRSSGPGGQNVNKIESAVRITHIPTGIVATSQTERLQGKNKANAMKVLYAKLFQLKEEQNAKELKEIKGDLVSTRFGNQIRSYVLHPYKMVKDLCTQYETSDAESVLDGNLEEFINAELKMPS